MSRYISIKSQVSSAELRGTSIYNPVIYFTGIVDVEKVQSVYSTRSRRNRGLALISRGAHFFLGGIKDKRTLPLPPLALQLALQTPVSRPLYQSVARFPGSQAGSPISFPRRSVGMGRERERLGWWCTIHTLSLCSPG